MLELGNSKGASFIEWTVLAPDVGVMLARFARQSHVF